MLCVCVCAQLTLELNDQKWPQPPRLGAIWDENREALLEWPLRTVMAGTCVCVCVIRVPMSWCQAYYAPTARIRVRALACIRRFHGMQGELLYVVHRCRPIVCVCVCVCVCVTHTQVSEAAYKVSVLRAHQGPYKPQSSYKTLHTTLPPQQRMEATTGERVALRLSYFCSHVSSCQAAL